MEISCKKYEKKLKILTLKDTFGRENPIEVPFCFIYSILIFQVNFLIFKTRLWMNDLYFSWNYFWKTSSDICVSLGTTKQVVNN